jgi:hypothetical protein
VLVALRLRLFFRVSNWFPRHPTVFDFPQIESHSTQLLLEAWRQRVALRLILPVLIGSLGACNVYDDRPSVRRSPLRPVGSPNWELAAVLQLNLAPVTCSPLVLVPPRSASCAYFVRK